MRIVSAVIEPGAVRRILRHLGEITEAPAIAGPRAPPGAPGMESEPCPLDLRDRDPAAIPAGLVHKPELARWLLGHAKATAPLVIWLRRQLG